MMSYKKIGEGRWYKCSETGVNTQYRHSSKGDSVNIPKAPTAMTKTALDRLEKRTGLKFT